MSNSQLSDRLRKVIAEIRRKPYPISDLIPLLSEAADALRPVQVPMTRDEILAMVDDYTFFGSAEEIVRAIEAHHGIKPKEQA